MNPEIHNLEGCVLQNMTKIMKAELGTDEPGMIGASNLTVKEETCQ